MARMIFSCEASPASNSATNSPFVHHVDAVAHAQQLGHLRRDHQDAAALFGQAGDERVDLELGAHVDAARGLVEDQQRRVGEQPLGQHHLLLVAARQVDHRLVHAGAADGQSLAVVVGDGELAAFVDHAVARHTVQVAPAWCCARCCRRAPGRATCGPR
jgi:hypothetical protein